MLTSLARRRPFFFSGSSTSRLKASRRLCSLVLSLGCRCGPSIPRQLQRAPSLLCLSLRTLGVTTVTSLPLALGILSSRGEWLRRHYLWLIEGGEWDHTKYSAQNTFFEAIGRSFDSVIALLTPQGAGDTWAVSNGIFPEWTLVVLALVGFCVSLRDARATAAITVPGAITFLVILLSNPTPWRASILGLYVLLFSVVGTACLCRMTTAIQRHVLSISFLAVHFVLFISSMVTLVHAASSHFVEGRFAAAVVTSCGDVLEQGSVVAYEHDGLALLQAIRRSTQDFRFFPRTTPIEELVALGGDSTIVLSEELRSRDFGESEVRCHGRANDLYFWVLQIQSK